MGSALIAVLAIAPWLSLTPLASTPLAAAILGALTLLAACHGAGQALALATRRGLVSPALAAVWGLAVLIVIGGLLAVCGVYASLPLLGGGAALHTLVIVQARSSIAVGDLRWAVPAFLLLACLALMHTVGAAGALTARPFDDDGHVIAHVTQLVQTGTLGQPGIWQLGGNVVMGSFAADPLHALAIDRGVCLALALSVVCTRIRLDDANGGMWAAIVVLVAGTFAFASTDASPTWSAIALLVALYVTAEQPNDSLVAAIPAVIVAAAIIALRVELAPAAVTMILVAAPSQGSRLRGVGGVLLMLVVALAPYLLARLATSDPTLAPKLPSLAVRAALFVVVVSIAAPVLALATRPLRWPAYATAAGIAGIISQLAGDRPYATRFVWPLVIALVLALVIDLARRPAGTLARIVALFAVLFIYEGMTARGRFGATARYIGIFDSAKHLRYAMTPGADYRELQAQIPDGATLAVSITNPEQLDYTRHRIIDLRTPRAIRVRDKLIRRATYLLVDMERGFEPRGRVVATRGALQLVELQ